MRLDNAIRRRGFRRWYERQLYESHACLVTGLLALIMMAVAVELISFRESPGGLLSLLAIGAAGGLVCVAAWRQFTYLLFRAEYVAERATCPACGAYGRFAVEHSAEAPATVIGCTLQVRCRVCARDWRID